MAKTINMQNLVTHITNGTFEHKYCKICLLPLDDLFENVFTTVCKEDSQYCVADVLVEMCQIKVSSDDNFKICPKCFTSALEAYKFFLLTKRSQDILNHCIDGLYNQIEFIDLPENLTTESLCITLPAFTSNFDFDFDISQFSFQKLETIDTKTVKSVSNSSQDGLLVKKEVSDVESDIEENLVIVMNEDNEPKFFKPQKNGSLTLVKNNDISYENKEKKTRKRNRMEYKMCTRCPVKYRFVGKLKDHMKQEHGVDIFVCRVCQEPIEDEQEFKNHLRTHTGVRTCTICNVIFKKKDNILGHFKWHAKMKDLGELENANICEICGLMFETEEFLKEHHEKKHVNRYTCFYCGKMYKGELSFERHIKKHEMNKNTAKNEITTLQKKSSYICETCGKNFVDERALLWHERLHKDERPYICDVCGRGFVSVNRRNQHALCSHTAPARRCPLCPALFHLRSMVNTHIRKVHLKAHKRRNRTVKRQNVFWKTETVPIQELSVSLQNEILELQAAQKDTTQANHT